MRSKFLQRARAIADDFAQFRRALAARREVEARMREHVSRQLQYLGMPAVASGGPFHKNLIMGLVVGYGPAELAPFLESLREHGYAGDVAFLTFQTGDETSAYIESHGVIEIPFDSMPFLGMSMNSARMLKYLEYVRSRVIQGSFGYDYVLLADVRDIVFQGDPFARVGGGDIYYFLEEGLTIGTSPVNADWMLKAFGPEILRQTRSHLVSCAGTLIARPHALLEYLLWMAHYLAESRPEVRYSGIDQAIHNYLMVNGIIKNAQAVANGHAVMTVSVSAARDMRIGEGGWIYNPDGSLSEVVHQYDRDERLLQAIRNRYEIKVQEAVQGPQQSSGEGRGTPMPLV